MILIISIMITSDNEHDKVYEYDDAYDNDQAGDNENANDERDDDDPNERSHDLDKILSYSILHLGVAKKISTIQRSGAITVSYFHQCCILALRRKLKCGAIALSYFHEN